MNTIFVIFIILSILIFFVLISLNCNQYKLKHLKVKYDDIEINHQTLTKEQVVNRPTIIIPENHYVLMYDRNPAVNPARIHLLTDIKDIYKRKDIFPYIEPNPPVNSGIHNYIFILCKGVPPYSPSDRNGFNPTPFYNNIIAMNYFFIDTIK
jgi:hypothetical protein